MLRKKKKIKFQEKKHHCTMHCENGNPHDQHLFKEMTCAANVAITHRKM
jgi:hypothetical protein